VQESGRFLEFGDLMSIASLDVPELRDPPFTPVVPPALRDASDRSST
jgi:polyphosphate kinase